jgi:uncharacterized protein (TIGR01777 family)
MKNKRKIMIAGGTGYMGTALKKHFNNNKDQVIILSRSTSNSSLKWDGKTIGDWAEHLKDTDILINLSGKSVDCRYTEKNKQLIMSSRVESTQVLQQAMEQCPTPPKLWINASTATIYKGSTTHKMTEENGVIGDDFSMTVAKTWEKVFFQKEIPNVRKVALRTSLVLDDNGGVLPVLRKLVKFGFGGKMGSGKQKFAYVKMNELIKMIDFIIENESLMGPINCTSVNDITNEEFMTLLRSDMNKKIYFNNPEWLLSIGGKMIGTEKELILKSRFVYPKVLEVAGFTFDKSVF